MSMIAITIIAIICIGMATVEISFLSEHRANLARIRELQATIYLQAALIRVAARVIAESAKS